MLNKKGQALVEYVLIIALITGVAIAGVKFFGGYIKDKLTEMSCSITDQDYVAGNNPGDGKCVLKSVK